MLDITEAYGYIEQVNREFRDQPENFEHFLSILDDYNHKVIDIGIVIDKVTTLFRGRDDLLEGFSIFVPDGYYIFISDPNTFEYSNTRELSPVRVAINNNTTSDSEDEPVRTTALALQWQPPFNPRL